MSELVMLSTAINILSAPSGDRSCNSLSIKGETALTASKMQAISFSQTTLRPEISTEVVKLNSSFPPRPEDKRITGLSKTGSRTSSLSSSMDWDISGLNFSSLDTSSKTLSAKLTYPERGRDKHRMITKLPTSETITPSVLSMLNFPPILYFTMVFLNMGIFLRPWYAK